MTSPTPPASSSRGSGLSRRARTGAGLLLPRRAGRPQYGPQGRYAIARATGLDPVAVARRLSELVAQGLCRRVEGVLELTPTGRSGSVWEATS